MDSKAQEKKLLMDKIQLVKNKGTFLKVKIHYELD